MLNTPEGIIQKFPAIRAETVPGVMHPAAVKPDHQLDRFLFPFQPIFFRRQSLTPKTLLLVTPLLFSQDFTQHPAALSPVVHFIFLNQNQKGLGWDP